MKIENKESFKFYGWTILLIFVMGGLFSIKPEMFMIFIILIATLLFLFGMMLLLCKDKK